MSAPSGSRPLATPILMLLTAAGLLFGGYRLWQLDHRMAALQQTMTQDSATLQQVLAEVNRMRIEQSAGVKGPQALLEKLRTYAPLLASSRTAEPDFKNAQLEMEAILRAFPTHGADAWKPIMARLEKLDPIKDFDEIKWLLEAALRVDPQPAKQMLQEILLGHRMPSSRLRLYTARMLTDADKPLAQSLLRRILTTESSRGINPDRALAYGPIPDTAAFATTGFHNFVVHYVRSGDAQIDDTLLMLLGRAEHDTITIQECVKALTERRCERAIEPIWRLYTNPPQEHMDELFARHCLSATATLLGKAAIPRLEEALPKARTETMAKHIQQLLTDLKKQ
jgi:hypothetical protein